MNTIYPRSTIAAARRTFHDINKLAILHSADQTLGPLYAGLRDTAKFARTITESRNVLPSDTMLILEEFMKIVAELRWYCMTGNYLVDELADFYNLPPDYVRALLK